MVPAYPLPRGRDGNAALIPCGIPVTLQPGTFQEREGPAFRVDPESVLLIWMGIINRKLPHLSGGEVYKTGSMVGWAVAEDTAGWVVEIIPHCKYSE